jgi:hypothetical protein
MKSFHTFGCPAYVLDARLANGKKIGKWMDRSKVGIYLGPSPHHARSVGLILNMQTGLVTPQFHVRYDSTFQTMQNSFKGEFPESLWQDKCHFTQDELNGDELELPTDSKSESTKPTRNGAGGTGLTLDLQDAVQPMPRIITL